MVAVHDIRVLGLVHMYQFSFENTAFSFTNMAFIHMYLMKMELLKSAFQSGTFWKCCLIACMCGRKKMELFKNADITLSVSIHSAQYYKLIQDGRQVFHSLVSLLGLISHQIACLQAKLSEMAPIFLFHRLIIANYYAWGLSFKRYYFQVGSSYTCVWCHVWAQIVLKMRKTLHFKQLQISVDGVLLIRD